MPIDATGPVVSARSSPRSISRDESVPVPPEHAVDVAARAVRGAMHDVDSGGPSPRSTRHTRIDDAPKSTATTRSAHPASRQSPVATESSPRAATVAAR